MTPTHAAALHWQEAQQYRAWARRYPQRRAWYERLAREADADRQRLEAPRTHVAPFNA